MKKKTQKTLRIMLKLLKKGAIFCGNKGYYVLPPCRDVNNLKKMDGV